MTRRDTSAPPPLRRDAAWFVAWVVVGAACALGVLGALTIGIFLLPVALVALVVLATRSGAAVGAPGAISGLGLPALYVSYLNRSGPGDVCTVTARSASCTEAWNPWPWLVAGLLLVLAGPLVFRARRRRPAGRA